jgi:hypothetical protein
VSPRQKALHTVTCQAIHVQQQQHPILQQQPQLQEQHVHLSWQQQQQLSQAGSSTRRQLLFLAAALPALSKELVASASTKQTFSPAFLNAFQRALTTTGSFEVSMHCGLPGQAAAAAAQALRAWYLQSCRQRPSIARMALPPLD